MMSSPKAAARWLLLALMMSVCYLDYWQYSRDFHATPDIYLDIVRGTASAPMQYRVLIVRAAWFLHNHAHMGLRHALTLIDFVAACIAGFVALALLERSSAYRRMGGIMPWFASAAFLFLAAYYLQWITWYQRPETLPTACFVVLMSALVSLRPRGSADTALIAAASLLLAFLQALTRADVAVCFYAGVFITALLPLPGDRRLPAPRGFIAGVSAVCVLLAGATQWWMMHRVYPAANYGDTPLVQFFMNLTQPLRLLPFALIVLPTVWAAWTVLRRRASVDTWMLPVLMGALLFAPLWIVVGKLDEVRIFLPFAFALIPLTVSLLMEQLPPFASALKAVAVPAREGQQ